MNNNSNHKFHWLAAGCLTGLLAGSPALADDTEVFLGNLSASPESRPNVLFILDTSGSMGTEVAGSQPTMSRLQVLQDVTTDLLETTENINIGLMRFSSNGEGGMVVHPIDDIQNARLPIQTAIQAFEAGGNTPLSESLYEAGLYFLGEEVDYGTRSTGNRDATGEFASQTSVASSRTGLGDDGGDYYAQPAVDSSCRKNYIVLLTDGIPVEDVGADALIPLLPAYMEATGSTEASCDGEGQGRCLDDMAAYLFNTDLDSGTAGIQNVITYTIGFGPDIEAASLELTAERGGGSSYVVLDFDSEELKDAFGAILTQVSEKNTAFSSPAVAINAFNRTQTLDDLYFAVFKAQAAPHWDGNLKKYRFAGGQIVGVNPDVPAVDPNTGFFSQDAQSFWSAQADGYEAALGGAASRLPDPASRIVYTFTGDALLSAESNNFDSQNVTAETLGIDPVDEDLASKIIDWARGMDVLDENDNGLFDDTRKIMGDPLHSTPSVIVYGGRPDTPDISDATIYFGTNDGFLHAIDAATGVEQFAFIPRELLKNLPKAFSDAEQALNSEGQGLNKAYGLDGAVQVLSQDVNGDGVISSVDGDRVVLYFGMRRGEDDAGRSYYYAIDVSDRDNPRQLWVAGPDQLPGLGQTWSTPMITRVDIQGVTQNSMNTVLIFGGGYSETQDIPGYSTDDVGNAVFMIDAESGNRLWSAGDNISHNLVLTGMNNSIPSNVQTLDLDSDGFADRLYVGDMGGRIWRFDIFNGETLEDLVAGGVVASLGAADMVTPTTAENRRFYNAPDIAYVPSKTSAYLNISIGSGYRAHPLNEATNDRFYAIRDYNVFNKLSQDEYDALSAGAVTDGDPSLIDVTNDLAPLIPAGARGWKLSLPGEKVLSESRTFGGTVIFSTFSPGASNSPCEPGQGINKLYQLSIADASPVTNLDGIGSPEALSLDDRSRTLAQTGIAPTPTFLFPSPEAAYGEEACDGDDCSCEGDDCGIPPPRCIVGLEACDVDFGNPAVRTFWTQRDIDAL